jgi:uncharacterized protein (TIGR02679 family)
MSAELPDWVANPALAPLWARLRARVEAKGLAASGQVQVELGGRQERHAVGALLGRSLTRDRVSVDLAKLDERLRERSGVGGLLEVLTAVGGAPLKDLAAQRAAFTVGRERPLELALSSIGAPWGEEWVRGLRRTGLLTNRPDAVRMVTEAVTVLQALTAVDELSTSGSRVELAARLLGDAHALDQDRLMHQVVLRGLAAAAGCGVPTGAAERRALWEAYGAGPDLVSRTCLTWGLRPTGDQAVARRLVAAADSGDPIHLTAWDLRRLSSLEGLSDATVLVCENPRVLEAVAEHARSPWPVVCTSGEPNTVVTAMLGMLVEGGARLRYHGDFDWPGVAIANRVVARFAAVPWRMNAEDYEEGVRAEAPRLTGKPVEPSWDPELGAAMRAHGRCLHEESVLVELLTAL